MNYEITGEYITIGQLLKKMGVISTGGQAKEYLKNNLIKINGKEPIGRNSKVYLNSTLWINDNLFKIVEKKD